MWKNFSAAPSAVKSLYQISAVLCVAQYGLYTSNLIVT